MKKSWKERLFGILLIIAAYAALAPLVEAAMLKGSAPDFSRVWLFIGYAGGLALVIGGSYLLLARKHPPFALWPRIGAILAYWNAGAISIASQGIQFPMPPGYMVGFGGVENVLASLVIPAGLYLLLAGERADKPPRQTTPDSRIKWIRACGAAIVLWPMFHAVLVILGEPWQGSGALNVELFIIVMIVTLVSVGLGTALLAWPHKAEKPIP